MGNRHFVTILGTGNYSKCVYETEDGQFLEETPFVQIAVLNHVMAQYRPGDKITVFATKTAEEKNWNTTEETSAPDKTAETKAPGPETSNMQAPAANSIPPRRIHTYGKKTFRTLLSPNAGTASTAAKPDMPPQKSEPVRTSFPVKTVRTGLDALLQEKFPRAARQVVRIPEGRNKQELNKIFECIYEELSENEVIYFDFTHGLRNLPMQALAVVNYAKVLKKVTVGGLYYGAFELGRMEEAVNKAGLKCEKKHVPILDMSFCSTLQDWTGAAETFVKGGSGNQIKSLYDDSREDKDAAGPEYRDIVDRLYDLTNCLETSRGVTSPPDKAERRRMESINAAHECFKHSYSELHAKELSGIEKHIEPLIEYIYDDVKILDAKLFLKRGNNPEPVVMKNTSLGMASVKWAIEKNLLQQAYTALNETLISYVCELFGVSANYYDGRENVRQTLRIVNPEYEKSHSPAGFETQYRQANWLSIYKTNANKYKPIYQFEETAMAILSSLPEEVFSLAKLIVDDRNSLNHFGFQQSSTISYDKLAGNLSDRYKQMMHIITDNPDIDASQFPFDMADM